ncbi:MAG: hypothetical protein U0822_17360 [Anaerolineae bacterium]
MKLRVLLVSSLLILSFAALAVGVAVADTRADNIGQAVPLTAEPAQGTLGPNESTWYMFYVPKQYPLKQQEKDRQHGVIITPQQVTMTFEDASNPELALNSGFRLYTPTNVRLLMRGELPPWTEDKSGHPVRGPWYFAVGSPESHPGDSGADASQAIGRPKVWQGVLADQGTFYLEVYNDSNEPMDYTLTISGDNLDLSPDAPSPPDLGPGPLPKTTPFIIRRTSANSNSGGGPLITGGRG